MHFKIWMKLSCAGSDNDTIALEAHAFLSRVASNDSVTVCGWHPAPAVWCVFLLTLEWLTSCRMRELLTCGLTCCRFTTCKRFRFQGPGNDARCTAARICCRDWRWFPLVFSCLLFFCLCLLLRAYLPHNSLLLTHDLICDLNAALHTATRKCKQTACLA